METVGGLLSTVTLTAGEVVWLPGASRATAVRVREPSAASVVFQEMEYGAAVTSAPRLAPSSLNCTPTTPTSSEALADTVIVRETVVPFSNEVMTTVVGVLSISVVNVKSDEVARFPAASFDGFHHLIAERHDRFSHNHRIGERFRRRRRRGGAIQARWRQPGR